MSTVPPALQKIYTCILKYKLPVYVITDAPCIIGLRIGFGDPSASVIQYMLTPNSAVMLGTNSKKVIV